jgi:hypothetical protein
MILVIYNKETLDVIDTIPGVLEVEATSDGIKWDGGSLSGLKCPYVLLPDDAEVGESLSPSQLSGGASVTSVSPEVALRNQNKALTSRVDFLEEVLTEMIFSIYEK